LRRSGVDNQGDAFFVAFARAQDALAGAIEGQRALASHPWPEGAELRVRMGMHTGEPTVTDEGYVGADVHLGARICAAAWGEQILVSDATARLLGDFLEASLRDQGEHSLKDIDKPVRLQPGRRPRPQRGLPPAPGGVFSSHQRAPRPRFPRGTRRGHLGADLSAEGNSPERGRSTCA
jgi:class 3 adenylate cyclase